MELDRSVMIKGQELFKQAGLVCTYPELDTLFVKPIEEQMLEQAENSWNPEKIAYWAREREIRQLNNLH